LFNHRLRPVFDRIDRGEMVAVTSELALAEILVKPLRDGNLVARQEFEAMLVPGGPLKVEPVRQSTLIRSAELRAAHASLKLPDAIHAATALLAGCTTS
jgi:predicted nucleic acid-binding protein